MSPESRKRRIRRRRRKAPSPAGTRGDEYQRAVAEVARSISPGAIVEVGSWVNGPDGRRDLDVVLRPANGSGPVVAIECKDWNKPIGIAFIDALDSKRHDIGATAAMICSNSGFTSDALRKAARVGIPTLSALISGDRRIRVVVREQIYTRIVTFEHHSPFFHHPRLSEEARTVLSGPTYTREWSFEGHSMESWVAAQLLAMVSTATASRSFCVRYTFRDALTLRFRDIPIEVSGIDIRAAYRVQWMTQVAEIGASKGMYDYLRKVVIFGPGPYQFQITVDSETWGTPVPASEVPPRLLVPVDQRQTPVVTFSEFTLGMVKNMPQSSPRDAPNLEPFILSEEFEDLDEPSRTL